ncbi:N-lysine methyltransferase KMT5A-like [Leptopilina heterotoma]|uniref:N-lysine methyltransferase KMT5A-like n=1 Tax=Leptopilina heterotoma TaxID=63436 RepID=UPI001CA9294B|nr:N-lysine methyltransferase KMT5A-like [Leptopilina heterotoma]
MHKGGGEARARVSESSRSRETQVYRSKGEFVVEYIEELISGKEGKVRDSQRDQNQIGDHSYYFNHRGASFCIDAAADSDRLGKELLYDYGDSSKESLKSFPWLKH